MSHIDTPDARSGTTRLRNTAEEATATAARETTALKDKALSGVEEAKTEAAERSEAAKRLAAGEISQTSQALRSAADELESGSIQHQMFTQAADAVGSVSDALNNRSIGEIVDDLSRFGRRNPAALIGGAVLAGLMVSRFLRASDSGEPRDDTAHRAPPALPDRVAPSTSHTLSPTGARPTGGMTHG